ncbi:MAG: hypothetical protein QM761_01445 [Pseudoxanthomonas sp.]
MNTGKIHLFAAFIVLSGFAATAQCGSKPKSISYKEAAAFEQSLLARGSVPLELPEPLYVQPINKREACKLPTSRDQLDRPNFRAYWDGECKNGFAFGLGRDIAISDTHHFEEITIHNGAEDYWPQISVDYNYVENAVSYAVRGSKYPAQTSLMEKMDNSVAGFNTYQTLTIVDESGKELILMTSPFSPKRIYINGSHQVGYRFTDYSAVPVTSQGAAQFTVEILERGKGGVPGGVAIARYVNGVEQHFRVVNGVPAEPVRLPADYVNHLLVKYQEVYSATSQAYTGLQRAQQIEREYLFKACNGKSGIEGLDNATYTKICTWRDQFKEPYAAASANYQQKLESMRQQAATAEQQRQIQQQIAMQQQMLQQQQNQQRWNELNQSSQQLQQRTQQTLQGVMNMQVPQVQPVAPTGGSQIICHTIGSITTCR